MPSFDLDANLSKDRAYRLAVNGPVSITHKQAVLDETLAWLTDYGYVVHRLNAAAWTTQADFHRDIKAALDFPDYYGHNLDAFNDCMRDVAHYEYGTSRDATGTILAFTGYDAFTAHEPRAAQVILDILANTARTAMLVGHRMLFLLQSNDPNLTFTPVGGTPVNPADN